MTDNVRKLVFFLMLLGMAWLAHAFIVPANKRLAVERTQLQTKLKKLQQLKEATATTQSLDKQLEQLEETVSFFESKLPPQSRIHKVLEQVAVIAQKQGLKTKTIRTLKQKDYMGYIEQPLKMELYGNFRSYYSFLLELERLPRIIKIRELGLIKDHKAEGVTTAGFIVSIFFQNKSG